MNTKIAGLAAITFILFSSTAIAQGGNPGAHFIENWDDNGDGVVTLAEVETKRADVFYMFDQDENGQLSAQEYVLFDETREDDMAQENAQVNGGQGNGGQGKGGNGGGHGNSGNSGNNGNGGNDGGHRGAEGMTLEFNDLDGDGQVSEEEFVSNAKNWFATMDRNGDDQLSTADFGRPS